MVMIRFMSRFDFGQTNEKLSEKQIQSQIINYLNWNGFTVWRQNTGAMEQEYKGTKRLVRFGKVGMADIIGLRKKDGKFIAVECKRPTSKNTLTQQQAMFLETIKISGGIAFMATSIADVERELTRYL